MKESQSKISKNYNRLMQLNAFANVRIAKSSDLLEGLSEIKETLIFLLDPNTSQLVPGLISDQDRSRVSVHLKPCTMLSEYIRKRPVLFTDISQIDESVFKRNINLNNPLDYLGNDPAILKTISQEPEYSLTRPRYVIDDIDNSIAKALGVKILQADPKKRPRIQIEQFYELYQLLPNKLTHLVNILNHGSSLILHRRSQRLKNFSNPSMNLSRIERLFYYSATPMDGFYPFSFEPEEEAKYIEYLLFKDKMKNKLIPSASVFVSHLLRLDILNENNNYRKILISLKVPIVVDPYNIDQISFVKDDSLPVEQCINLSDQSRYRSYKDPAGIVRVPNPGSRFEKTFYDRRYKELMAMPIATVKSYFAASGISKEIRPGSIGRISREGRQLLKRNLRSLYSYYQSVSHIITRNPDPYWIEEMKFCKIELYTYLLVWHTNTLFPIKE